MPDDVTRRGEDEPEGYVDREDLSIEEELKGVEAVDALGLDWDDEFDAAGGAARLDAIYEAANAAGGGDEADDDEDDD